MDGGTVGAARIDVLGPLRVQLDGVDVHVGGAKTRTLLAMLAHHKGEVVRFEALIEAVWGEDPPMSARNGLQVRIAELRKRLGDAVEIGTTPNGYVLDRDGVAVDVSEFEELAAAAEAALDGDPVLAMRLAHDALELWRGEPAADVLDIGSLRGRLAALDELRARVQLTRLDAQLSTGDHADACIDAATLIDEHPYREDFRARLMAALYFSGRQVESLRAFREARDLLVTELGVEPGPELQRIHRQVLEQDPALGPGQNSTDGPTDTSARRQRNNLLAEANRFVERPETDAVIAALEPRRVVTAVGTGGIGKSRCVAAVARRCLATDSYPDGVWIVDLAPLPPGSDQVATIVASAIGLGQQPNASPASTVVEYLRARTALIVLDNCEQVTDAVVAFIQRVLDDAPNITILAASRVRLAMNAERVVTLDRLPIDAAMQLLNARTTEIGAGPFTDDEQLELCEALDNFPLAIELAASRTRVLNPREIVERLAGQPELLQRVEPSGRTAPRDYVDLATALEWSVEQLSERARATLRHATIFVSDFDLASAEAVLANDDRSAIDVVDDLSELVEHNLVNRDHGRGRYRILEPIRQHLHTEDATVASAYSRHYAAFAIDAAKGIRGPDEAIWWNRINADLPHVREVVRSAIDCADVDLVDPLMLQLAITGLICGLTEPGEWAIDAFRRLDPEPTAAPGLACAAAIHYAHHKQPDECNAILDRLDGFVDDALVTTLLFGVRTFNDPGALDWDLWKLQDLDACPDRALSIHIASLGPRPTLEAAVEFGNPTLQVHARSFISARVLLDRHSDEARHNKHELYRVAMTSNNPYVMASGQSFMALQHCFDGEPRLASPLAVEMVEGYAKLRSPFWIWHAVEIVAVLLAMARFDPPMAEKLWAAVDASGTMPYARMTRNPELPVWVSAQLTDDEKRLAIAAGSALDMDRAALEARKAAESLADA